MASAMRMTVWLDDVWASGRTNGIGRTDFHDAWR